MCESGTAAIEANIWTISNVQLTLTTICERISPPLCLIPVVQDMAQCCFKLKTGMD